jgi:SAM-dependent methyltransferase
VKNKKTAAKGGGILRRFGALLTHLRFRAHIIVVGLQNAGLKVTARLGVDGVDYITEHSRLVAAAGHSHKHAVVALYQLYIMYRYGVVNRQRHHSAQPPVLQNFPYANIINFHFFTCPFTFLCLIILVLTQRFEIFIKIEEKNLIINKNIDGGKAFDWGRASEDYAKFRDIYPEEFYEKIISLGLCVKGQKVLDLGTGTGVLPRNMYKYGAKFIGADISGNQIEQARLLTAEANMDIEYVAASAETVDFPVESFDVITACQCFMYFDKAVALPKIHKMLKTGGHFCVLFMAWLPFESEIAKRSEELVLKYNPHWSAHGMKRHVLGEPDWSRELFDLEVAETFDLTVAFTRETWHGRMRACRGVIASSLSDEEKAAWNREHSEYVLTLPETFDILHFASVLNLRKK